MIDNAFDAARQPARRDALRLARLAAVRMLVREKLEAIEQQIVAQRCGAMSSTAFDNLRSIADSPNVGTFESTEEWLASSTPDPAVEERRFLRRLLRLLNKVMTIALRREAFDRNLQGIGLQQRSFFITHGNHPPPPFLRHLTMPRSCAA